MPHAGEAGKGFAVDAAEVMLLATQTAKATDEISLQIETMRNMTASTIDSFENIISVIRQMNNYASKIAMAVEE